MMDQTVMFWLLVAALTALALALLLFPLLRRPGKALARAEYDLAIYRDQMRELEEEIAQGLVEPDVAERARNEIARRILAADDARRRAQEQLDAGSRSPSLPVALFAAALVPALAFVIYLQKGEPGRPDMPLQRRLSDAVRNHDLAALVKRAEQRLKKNPNDLRGWLALAPAYEKLGRLDDAVRAWRRAIALSEKPSADLYDALGEALVLAARGQIGTEAEKAFARALQLHPGDAMSRYYLAMAELQKGHLQKARDGLKALLADLPKDAPARAIIVGQLRRLETSLAGEPKAPKAAAANDAAGPSPDAVRARMRQMKNASPEQRMAMIRNMVDGLAARLKDDPKNLSGWLRLIRARKVLGEEEKARAALRRAREVFAGDARATGRLAALAAELGLK